MVSVVFPIYVLHEYSQKDIVDLYQYLQVHYSSVEFILVDDGPKQQDNIRTLAQQSGFTYIRDEYVRGKGHAIQSGILASRGDVIVFTDADVPYQFQNLCDVIRQILNGYDVAIGDRTLPASAYFEHMPWYRNLASVMFSRLVRWLMLPEFADTQCGLKGFRADVAQILFQHLSIKGYAFDVEILFRAKNSGYRISRIPVQYRKYGKTSIHLMHALKMIQDVIKLFLKTKFRTLRKTSRSGALG